MRINLVVSFALAVTGGISAGPLRAAAQPDVKTIIQKSVEANHADFQQDPNYNNKERDRDNSGDHTYQITMIDGWPYKRVLAVNGHPLSDGQAKQELAKEQAERQKRASMSAEQRNAAIQKYQRGRERDAAMMGQLTEAFNFQLQGERNIKGRSVYVLRAIPKPGYNPPNRDCQVLTGMQGELWIDTQSFQWVKVTAQVIHPVSIEGFLATVQPGTRFELEKVRVNDHYWAPSHFAERADAKVLGLFSHREHEDDTFWDYTPATK